AEEMRAEGGERMMARQQEVAFEWSRGQVGKEIEVIVDGADPEVPNHVLARGHADAPDIDGQVRVKGKGLRAGDLARVKVTAADGYDLVGRAIGQGRGTMATATPPRRPALFNLPHQVTASRFVLGVVLFVLIHLKLWVSCIVVFALAATTDWLDGYFARKQGLVSSLGRNLDPLVDKVVVCGAYIFLLPMDGAGIAPWMVTVVVGRELIITSLRSFLENLG